MHRFGVRSISADDLRGVIIVAISSVISVSVTVPFAQHTEAELTTSTTKSIHSWMDSHSGRESLMLRCSALLRLLQLGTAAS